MITITIPPTELWDETKEQFVSVKKPVHLTLEHSLVSISKWESKWHESYLNCRKMTSEQALDYIKCMTLDKNVDDLVYRCIPDSELTRIRNYILDPMTATKFKNNKPSREIITSEIIYYWMTALNVPFECQKWHLNRLLTLIRVCSEKSQPSKKMSQKEIMSMNHALNAQRHAALGHKR